MLRPNRTAMHATSHPRETGRTAPAGSAPLSATAELEAYEALRRHDARAFHDVALTLQPLLRRLAALSTDDPVLSAVRVADAWYGALRSLGMFTWHTSLTVWVASGVLRAPDEATGATASLAAPVDRSAPLDGQGPGPSDWSDLPFGARWDGAIGPLSLAHHRLPHTTRVVLHLHEVERWSTQDGCDVLGLTRGAYLAALGAGHDTLHDVLAHHVGEPATVDDGLRRARTPHVAAALRLAHGPVVLRDDDLDPLTLDAFRSWALGELPLHRRLVARLSVRRLSRARRR